MDCDVLWAGICSVWLDGTCGCVTSDASRDEGGEGAAVLRGIEEADNLAPHADVVLPDISHLAAWIDGQPRL